MIRNYKKILLLMLLLYGGAALPGSGAAEPATIYTHRHRETAKVTVTESRTSTTERTETVRRGRHVQAGATWAAELGAELYAGRQQKQGLPLLPVQAPVKPADDRAYEAGALALVKEDGKWGILGKHGRFTTAPRYDRLQYQEDGVFVAGWEGKTWHITTYGKVVTAPEIRRMKENVHFYHAKKGYGLMAPSGKPITPPIFSEVLTPFQEGLGFVKTGKGKVVAVDATGQTVFVAPSSRVKPFVHGLAEFRRTQHRVNRGRLAGMVLQNSFSAAGMTITAATPVTYQSEKRGYMDRSGKIVIDTNYDAVYPMTEWGTFISHQGKLRFVDRQGKILIPPGAYRLVPQQLDLVSGRAALEDKKTGRITVWSLATGKRLSADTYEAVFFLSPSLWAAKEGRSLVLIQASTGTPQAVLPDTIGILPSGEEDYTWVYGTEHAYRIIERTGRTVYTAAPQTLQAVKPFRHGLSAVKKEGKWGVVDSRGRIVVPFLYEAIELL